MTKERLFDLQFDNLFSGILNASSADYDLAIQIKLAPLRQSFNSSEEGRKMFTSETGRWLNSALSEFIANPSAPENVQQLVFLNGFVRALQIPERIYLKNKLPGFFEESRKIFADDSSGEDIRRINNVELLAMQIIESSFEADETSIKK